MCVGLDFSLANLLPLPKQCYTYCKHNDIQLEEQPNENQHFLFGNLMFFCWGLFEIYSLLIKVSFVKKRLLETDFEINDAILPDSPHLIDELPMSPKHTAQKINHSMRQHCLYQYCLDWIKISENNEKNNWILWTKSRRRMGKMIGMTITNRWY